MAETVLSLAGLALEKADLGTAEQRAKRALALFHEMGNADRESEVNTFLALCRLQAGQTAQAWDFIRTARPVAGKSENHRLRLFFAVAHGRVLAALGRPQDARQVLGEAVRTAPEAGFVPLELEARLALGETEIRAGDLQAGRSRLAALEREAERKGFRILARKAAGARGLAHAPP